MTKDKIRELVNDLIQTKRTSESSQLSSPVFHVNGFYEFLQPYFSEKAKAVLSKKSNSTIYQWNEPTGDIKKASQDAMIWTLSKLDIKSARNYIPVGEYIRKFAKSYYFGFTVSDKENISKASLKLVDIINHMASLGFIKACLMNTSLFEFSDINDLSIKKYAIVAYIHIPSELEEQVKNTYGRFMFNEGETPPEYK